MAEFYRQPKGTVPPFPFGSRKRYTRRRRAAARRLWSTQHEYFDAQESDDNQYSDATDDPTETFCCLQCRRRVRDLLDQTPPVGVFPNNICGCRGIYCEQCLSQRVRGSPNRCKRCGQRWKNIEWTGHISGVTRTQIEYYGVWAARIVAILVTLMLIHRFTWNYQRRYNEVRDYAIARTRRNSLAFVLIDMWSHYLLVIIGLVIVFIVFTFTSAVFSRFYRTCICPIIFYLMGLLSTSSGDIRIIHEDDDEEEGEEVDEEVDIEGNDLEPLEFELEDSD